MLQSTHAFRQGEFRLNTGIRQSRSRGGKCADARLEARSGRDPRYLGRAQMSIRRRDFLAGTAALGLARESLDRSVVGKARGPFEPNWPSIVANYQ